MIKVTLKDGSVHEADAGISVAEFAKAIGPGLYKAACAARVNGEDVDLRTLLLADCCLEICTFDDSLGRHAFWHSAGHVLAQAVLRLFPGAQYAIGPAIDGGFYYDFDIQPAFTADDLTALEAEMKKIAKEALPILRREVSPDEAREIFKNQPYKLELLEKHSGAGGPVILYEQGEFVDLCAGPHLMNTAPVRAVKLTSATGAYWHGDSSLPMLCRVYGTAYPKQAELDTHLAMLEEARKRDHNKIGRELEYFTTVDMIGQGLPILMPNGAKVFQLLSRWIEDEEERRGYLPTKTPYMAKSDLYKLSGHWDHYLDGMFVVGDPQDEKNAFALRPMTCPFQYQIYLNRKRSYRELPFRYSETSTLFRKEESGEMHGLIRLRQFTISEGHLVVRPDQLDEEFKGCLDLAKYTLETLGLAEDVSYRFSKGDPENTKKYEGTPEQWAAAEGAMKQILDSLCIDYVEAKDEAAFYGPKLDIQIRNVFGKEDTLITIQIDMLLAAQYGMEYVAADGSMQTPYILHRTSLGCYERTMALLLEKYAGALPVWLMPTQVTLVPISEAHHVRANEILAQLKAVGIRAEADVRNEKMNYKIREAQLKKIPYMLVIGDKEVAEGTVAVRARKPERGGTKPVDVFITEILEEIAAKAR